MCHNSDPVVHPKKPFFFLLGSRLKKKKDFVIFLFFIYPNIVPYPGALRETFSQSAHTCVDENVMGEVCRHGLAWLGWDALPLPLPTAPPPPGSCGGSDKDGFPDQDQSDS